MSFLLKIVQGPNAGAEIALPVGITISLGKGDACDIVLSDASLAEKACEFEVTDERIMMLLPDGKQTRMEPYHVQMVGTTAFAVGPGEGAWQPLVWPTKPTAVVAEEPAAEKKEDAVAPAPEAPKEEPKAKKRRPFRRFCVITLLLLLILLLLLGIGAVVAYFFFPDKYEKGKEYSVLVLEKGKGYYGRTKSYVMTFVDSEKSAEEAAAEAPKPLTIEELAAQYGLQVEETKVGKPRLVGNFASRAERLQAIAQIYRAQPGVKLDVTDTESLTTAIENVLSLVAAGNLRLSKLEGRTAYLKGKVASEDELRNILEALATDVPSLVKTDCSEVSLPISLGAAPVVASVEASSEEPAEKREVAKPVAAEAPQFPVVGILTAPYPCLVLRDGSRILEGAHMGGYVVTSIAVDGVVLTNASGSFTWRP